MPELEPGAVFAGHRIVEIAGRGGMGVVYRAVALDLDRPVALKLIAAHLAEDPGFRERFVRESRAAAAIDHPNVIPIYYTGEHEGALYIAMRYVEGSDLRTLVRAATRLEAPRAAHIVAQVASALDAAHARGIVHRDVKPANVLLGQNDHAYLTDFGLTKRLGSHTAATHSGGWVGTLGYVAPEQIRDERPDARADVYALGCVLFHALTGEPPYQRESDEATLWAHLNDPPPPLRERAPEVPEAFQDVIARALAKDPDERFPSAGDLGRAALAAAGHGEGAPVPERLVATGAAAPAEAETAPSPQPAPTLGAVGSPAAGASAIPTTAVARRRRPAWAWALALLPVMALAVVAAIALSGDGGDSAGSASGRPAPAPAPGAAPGTIARTVRVSARPNDVVIASGRAWVVRAGSDRLAVLDAPEGRRLRLRPRVGAAPASAAAGFGRLWVVNQSQPALVAISLRLGRPAGAPSPLPAVGKVVAVQTGERGVWVGIRGTPGQLVRISPNDGRTVKIVEMPDGVQDIAVGAGAVWVLGRRADTVTRVDTETGRLQFVNVGNDPAGADVGEDALWITNSGDDTVTRVDTGSLSTRVIGVGDRPYGIAVGDGAVWVANRNASTLTRIDPTTNRVVGRPLEVAANPFAIDVHQRHVWITSPPDGAVQRIDFE